MKNTTLCYMEKDGAYLMLHRVKKENDLNRDKWIGVGGHCEENESPDACIRREIREETGLDALRVVPRGLVTFLSDEAEGEYMHLYTCDAFTGEPGDCDEGELVWVKTEDVPSLPIWEGDRIFLRLLAENAPYFELTLVYSGQRLTKAVLNGENLPAVD